MLSNSGFHSIFTVRGDQGYSFVAQNSLREVGSECFEMTTGNNSEPSKPSELKDFKPPQAVFGLDVVMVEASPLYRDFERSRLLKSLRPKCCWTQPPFVHNKNDVPIFMLHLEQVQSRSSPPKKATASNCAYICPPYAHRPKSLSKLPVHRIDFISKQCSKWTAYSQHGASPGSQLSQSIRDHSQLFTALQEYKYLMRSIQHKQRSWIVYRTKVTI